jgi:hypothetical protein
MGIMGSEAAKMKKRFCKIVASLFRYWPFTASEGEIEVALQMVVERQDKWLYGKSSVVIHFSQALPFYVFSTRWLCPCLLGFIF